MLPTFQQLNRMICVSRVCHSVNVFMHGGVFVNE